MEIFELERFLLAYTRDRFDISWNRVLGSSPLSTKKSVSFCTKLVESLVQALVKALYSVSDEIYLNDLANVVISQAAYMMRISLIYKPTMKFRVEYIFKTESFLQYQAEIHHWLIYLAENNKLPGKYEKYLGKFSRA